MTATFRPTIVTRTHVFHPGVIARHVICHTFC